MVKPTWKIFQGDALTVLRTLPDESVQTCVTSPPYWGLRDYGTATWDDGDSQCDHKIPVYEIDPKYPQRTSHDIRFNQTHCHKCNARRVDCQLGLEKTPEAYVVALVAVFREVKRVLRKDGTLWCNLGDSHFGANWRGSEAIGSKQATNRGANGSQHSMLASDWRGMKHEGLKPKDLVGIPWMVAFALRADGWWLRSDIIWSKVNPMPESVTDRPTKAHEYIFLLSKNARYYYDADAIKEPATHAGKIVSLGEKSMSKGQATGMGIEPSGNGLADAYTVVDSRNIRSVWTVPTAPFPEAHFATFPPKLIEPCILAGAPDGGMVLDPFCGSGTTGIVATRAGRNFIGIELNPEYITMAERRLEAENQQHGVFQ